ncbi:MAG: hypothetical protein AB7P20_25110 [Rhizobiaceae bacterium]
MRSIFTSQQTISVEGFRVLRRHGTEVMVTVYARVSDAEGEQGVAIPLPLTSELAKVLRVKLDNL